jgi:hypothetical protein
MRSSVELFDASEALRQPFLTINVPDTLFFSAISSKHDVKPLFNELLLPDLQLRKSPYLGYFRHSPPSSTARASSPLNVSKEEKQFPIANEAMQHHPNHRNWEEDVICQLLLDMQPAMLQSQDPDLRLSQLFASMQNNVSSLPEEEMMWHVARSLVSGRLRGGGKPNSYNRLPVTIQNMYGRGYHTSASPRAVVPSNSQVAMQSLSSSIFLMLLYQDPMKYAQHIRDLCHRIEHSTDSSSIKILCRLVRWFLLPLPESSKFVNKCNTSRNATFCPVATASITSKTHETLDELNPVFVDEDSTSSSILSREEVPEDYHDIHHQYTDYNDYDTIVPGREFRNFVVNGSQGSASFPMMPQAILSCHGSESYYNLFSDPHDRLGISALSISSSISVGGEDSLLSTHDDDFEMDDVITQMDIARMNRAACRHLDVESISQLPTSTYHEKPGAPIDNENVENVEKFVIRGTTMTGSNAFESSVASDGWSWMMVPTDPSAEETHQSLAFNNKRGIRSKASCDFVTGTDLPVSDPYHTCVICLDRFAEGDEIRVLPCNHSFHVGCIQHWFSGSSSASNNSPSGCSTCKLYPISHHQGTDEAIVDIDQHCLAAVSRANIFDDSDHESMILSEFDDVPGVAERNGMDRTNFKSSDTSIFPSWAFAKIGYTLSRHDSHRPM